MGRSQCYFNSKLVPAITPLSPFGIHIINMFHSGCRHSLNKLYYLYCIIWDMGSKKLAEYKNYIDFSALLSDAWWLQWDRDDEGVRVCLCSTHTITSTYFSVLHRDCLACLIYRRHRPLLFTRTKRLPSYIPSPSWSHQYYNSLIW